MVVFFERADLHVHNERQESGRCKKVKEYRATGKRWSEKKFSHDKILFKFYDEKIDKKCFVDFLKEHEGCVTEESWKVSRNGTEHKVNPEPEKKHGQKKTQSGKKDIVNIRNCLKFIEEKIYGNCFEVFFRLPEGA